MSKHPESPNGDLVIKTLAMPSDTNPNGDIFGGWVLSQMDLGGGIIAKTHSPSGRVVTVSIDSMSFINPVKVGDVVSCYADITNLGRTSMKISIETWVFNNLTQSHKIVTKGVFTYVAVNETGRPISIINRDK